MAAVLRKRSSGRQRLRQGYVGKTFHLDGKSYIVEDVIAEGGFAVVLDVRSTSGNNERLALKRIAVNNDHDLFLCRQEIAIMKALSDCPHSVTYLSSQINRLSREVLEVLILMQLYGGQPVINLLQQYHGQSKPLPEPLVMKIFCDVCVAVTRLHHRTKPITHRDLKIENVLQDFSSNFVLCDYGSCTTEIMNPKEDGISKCEEQIKKFTTLAYRAPEMVDLYSGHKITIKSDIWALGCMLYKLCFFDTPFGEQTLAIMRGTFTIPETSPFSNGLHTLTRYILNPNPEHRPDIFQVSHAAFKLIGKPNPVPNIFNSSLPIMPSQLVKPAVSKTSENKSVKSATPARLSPQPPAITTTTISSRERPRPRPLSTAGMPSPNMSTRQQQSSPTPTPRSTLHNLAAGHPQARSLTPTPSSSRQHESTDSLSQPLPPPVTDVFGQVPFAGTDSFGATPYKVAT